MREGSRLGIRGYGLFRSFRFDSLHAKRRHRDEWPCKIQQASFQQTGGLEQLEITCSPIAGGRRKSPAQKELRFHLFRGRVIQCLENKSVKLVAEDSCEEYCRQTR